MNSIWTFQSSFSGVCREMVAAVIDAASWRFAFVSGCDFRLLEGAQRKHDLSEANAEIASAQSSCRTTTGPVSCAATPVDS